MNDLRAKTGGRCIIEISLTNKECQSFDPRKTLLVIGELLLLLSIEAAESDLLASRDIESPAVGKVSYLRFRPRSPMPHPSLNVLLIRCPQ